MENDAATSSLDDRLARHVKALRAERGWSLDELAERSGVSRASLSRIENGEVSPTASALGRLCSAFGMTMSRLLGDVEGDFAALVKPDLQPVWRDPETGFVRRQVSPPARELAGEVIEGALPAGCRIAYDGPPRPGLEHHLLMRDGELTVSVEGVPHRLEAGDCLRYRLHGPSLFETPAERGARYLIFIV